TSDRRRRLSPLATAGEMCSSSRSLSMSGLPHPPGTDPHGAWEHTFESVKIRGSVFGDGPFDLLRKCFGIVEGSLDPGLWPLEVLGDRGYIIPISADEQHHFPYRKRASLNVGLSACGRVTEIDEGKVRSPETFFHQTRTGIARGPSMP